MKNIYMQIQVYGNLHVHSTTAYLRNWLHRITVFSYSTMDTLMIPLPYR